MDTATDTDELMECSVQLNPSTGQVRTVLEVAHTHGKAWSIGQCLQSKLYPNWYW